ncbi:hypothetical protein ACMTN4_00855 (plasmid) [Rhodococcus globerulus]|uniref:hypothetical protein n=1 Tax=Rhodococcus globerulus TaxID=33008 RepID=UPI0039E8C714
MHLLAHGITLDTAREHDTLWIWVIEQLMRACRHTPRADDPNQAVNPAWKNLGYLPAWLALRTASYAAIHAKRDDLLIRLHLQPTCYDQSVYDENGRPLPEAPAVAVLYEYRILVDTLQLILPDKKDFARGFLFSDPKLRPVFEPILGNQAAFTLLADRAEYRTALIQLHRGDPNCWAPVLSRTHYDGSDNFRDGGWRLTTDFTRHRRQLNLARKPRTQSIRIRIPTNKPRENRIQPKMVLSRGDEQTGN